MQKIGCLLLHGFAGNPGEVFPLSERLRAAGYDVISPVLAGHNASRRDLGLSSAEQWIDSSAEAYNALAARCDHVCVVGFSMGSLLAVRLAVQPKVCALAVVNMPVYYWDFRRIIFNIKQDFISHSPKYLKIYAKTCVDKPAASLYQFNKLLRRTLPLIGEITCPFYVAQGLLDDTVRAKSAPYVYNRAASREKALKYYEHGTHNIFHSDAASALIDDLTAFIKTAARTD